MAFGGVLNLLKEPPDQSPDRRFIDPQGIAQENAMFRKSALLAVAASAALGLALLGSNDAFARGHGGGGGGHGGGHGMHGGGGHGMHGGGGFRHVHGHYRHWHRHYVRWHRPLVYGYTGTATYAVARPAVAGPCTCLTKEYTPEGAVLFKDRCTNETAMNPPLQQSGAIEPQAGSSYTAQLVQPTPSNALPQQPIPLPK